MLTYYYNPLAQDSQDRQWGQLGQRGRQFMINIALPTEQNKEIWFDYKKMKLKAVNVTNSKMGEQKCTVLRNKKWKWEL